MFWGQNYVPVHHTPKFFPVFLFYSFWIFSSSFSSLLFNFFLFFSSYSFRRDILRLLMLLLLYFKVFVVLQTCIIIFVHISVILRGFSKGQSLFYLLILLYCTIFFLFLFFSSYNLTVCCITDMHMKHTKSKGT
jgi:hypothetical protein